MIYSIYLRLSSPSYSIASLFSCTKAPTVVAVLQNRVEKDSEVQPSIIHVRAIKNSISLYSEVYNSVYSLL